MLPLTSAGRRPVVAYAAALCERMLPNYQLFCESVNFSGFAEMRSILDLVWEWLYSSNARIDFEKQSAKLDAITPDPLEFDLYGVYPALDCCVAVSATLDLIQGESLDLVDEVSRISEETIRAFIEVSGTQMGQDLLEDDHNFKAAIVELLGTSGDVSNELKQLAKGHGVSNIGISLD